MPLEGFLTTKINSVFQFMVLWEHVDAAFIVRLILIQNLKCWGIRTVAFLGMFTQVML